MDKTTIRQFRKHLRSFERVTNLQLKTCCVNVTLSQCHALLEIESQKHVTLNRLSDLLTLEKSTVSRTVEDLVRMEYVRRQPHPSDRRCIWITLTPKGRFICDEINSQSDFYYSQALGMVPGEELERIMSSLQRLVESFISHEGCEGRRSISCGSTS